jgi:transposase
MISAKDKSYRFGLRRQLVLDAKASGLKATARRWNCSRNTVRRWWRRHDEEGLQGLQERSHAPKHCPHKTPVQVEQAVLRCRQRSGYGARRLKMEFDLPCGVEAIGRILRQHRLTRKAKTKRQKKNDLRAVKARLRAFETVQMDVKHLKDMAHYLPQMQLRHLPRYQYTIRDVRTGLQFLAFGEELSMSHATAAVGRFLAHLKRQGVSSETVTIQTDNGSEFDGQTEHPRDRGFRYTVETLCKARHRYTPPSCPNANADAESAHSLIETEWYDRESFSDLQDFLAKAWTYQCHFNLTRKNSYQQWRTPIERLRQADPTLPESVVLLPPVFLDTLLPHAPRSRPRYDFLASDENYTRRFVPARFSSGGQHQPEYPGFSKNQLSIALFDGAGRPVLESVSKAAGRRSHFESYTDSGA